MLNNITFVDTVNIIVWPVCLHKPLETDLFFNQQVHELSLITCKPLYTTSKSSSQDLMSQFFLAPSPPLEIRESHIKAFIVMCRIQIDILLMKEGQRSHFMCLLLPVIRSWVQNGQKNWHKLLRVILRYTHVGSSSSLEKTDPTFL